MTNKYHTAIKKKQSFNFPDSNRNLAYFVSVVYKHDNTKLYNQIIKILKPFKNIIEDCIDEYIYLKRYTDFSYSIEDYFDVVNSTYIPEKCIHQINQILNKDIVVIE